MMIDDESGYANASHGVVHTAAFCNMVDDTGYENARQGSSDNKDGVRVWLPRLFILIVNSFMSS